MHRAHGCRGPAEVGVGWGASLQFAGAASRLSLPLCHLVTPSLGRRTSAVRHSGRESQMRGEVSKGGRYSAFCSKMCLIVSVCRATACLGFPKAVLFAAFRLSKCNLRIRGWLLRISKCLARWHELLLGVCSACMHECYSWSELGLTCMSCTTLAVHVLCSEWEPGHSVLPWGVWL